MAPGYLTDRFALKIECMFVTLATPHILHISIVKKQSGDTVSYSIGNMNKKNTNNFKIIRLTVKSLIIMT